MDRDGLTFIFPQERVMTGRLTPQDIMNLNAITKFSASMGFIGVCSMGYVRVFDVDDL
jgi:hypothetical protein